MAQPQRGTAPVPKIKHRLRVHTGRARGALLDDGITGTFFAERIARERNEIALPEAKRFAQAAHVTAKPRSSFAKKTIAQVSSAFVDAGIVGSASLEGCVR